MKPFTIISSIPLILRLSVVLALLWAIPLQRAMAQQQAPCIVLPEPLGPDPCYVSIDTGCMVGVPGNDPLYCDHLNPTPLVVRVYAHIMRDNNGIGGRTLQSVNVQLQQMIDAFLPMGIIFSIEKMEEINNESYMDIDYFIGGANYSHVVELETQYGHPDGIDLYFCDLGLTNAVVGYGVLPNSDNPQSYAFISGGWGYHVIHEMGHVLGLLHTFETCSSDPHNCDQPEQNLSCECGDYVADTPFAIPLSEFDVDVNCVPEPPLPPDMNTDNYMQYLPGCATRFTEGQRRRMKRFLSYCGKLANYVSTDGTIRVGEGLDLEYNLVETPIYHYQTPCLGGFIVEPNAKLTLGSDFQFDEGGKIHVKAKGRLNVENVTLSGCGGGEWVGIEVDGNPSLGQIPTTNQGFVHLADHSTIENAINPLLVHGGGFVIAGSTLFHNCGTSIFEPYSKQNYSRFEGAQFVNDEVGSFTFTSNMKLTGVRRITFSNCSFSVSGIAGSITGTDKPTGILATDAKFYVGSNSSFDGYYNGVMASATGMGFNDGFEVRNTTFTDNYIGVENWGMDNALIHNNVFEHIGGYSVPPIHIALPIATGIVLRNCTGFKVEDNLFTGDDGLSDEIGILAYGTGSESNILQRNTFEGLNVANQAELSNKGIFPSEGLQYWCNTNSISSYDFFVFDEGICEHQGGGLATQNVFSHFNSNYGDFNNQSPPLVTYYHRSLQPETPLQGFYDNILPVTVQTSVGCTTGSNGGMDGEGSLTNQEEQDLNSNFNTTKSTYLSLLAQYNSVQPGSLQAIALAPQLTTHRSTMHRIANRIIRSEVSDTVSLDLPKIRTWLRNKASKEADYAIVDTWLLEGDTTRANGVLDSIPIVHGLTANDEAQHADFKAWVALLNQFASEEKDIYYLSANDVALVASIADGAQGMAAARAQGLLNALYGTDYRLSPKTPQAGGGGGGMLLKLPGDNGLDIKAYPNPANHTVQFDYHVPEDAPATLLVFDADGRRIEQATLAAGRGKAKLDTKAWRPGIYYYKVSCGQSPDFAPKKLVIIH